MARHGYVYLLKEVGGNRVKIGKSTRPPTVRIAEFSPMLPFETEIAHTIECSDVNWAESLMHDLFKSLHLRGEWFKIGKPDMDYIKSGAYDNLGQSVFCDEAYDYAP